MLVDSQIRAQIKKAGSSGKKRFELRDEANRGEGRLVLVVRIVARKKHPDTPHTVAEWYAVSYRGGKRMAKIGTYPTIRVADARSLFRKLYAPQLLLGAAPKGIRSRADAGDPTVLDLFTAYVEHLEESKSKRAAKVARCILLGTTGTDGVAAKIGPHLLAKNVTASDIIPHLVKIHDRGKLVMADQTRGYIRSAYSWAIKDANSYTGRASGWQLSANPAAAISRDPQSRRAGQRHLSATEFRAFWYWLDARPRGSATAKALQVQMATGQRVSEIFELPELHYERGEKLLTWPKTKNQLPHAIPLPQQAVAILNTAQCRNGFVFPSRTRHGESIGILSAPRLINSYLKETGADKFTARDLRRTWKTLAGAAGLSKEIRDRIQNHARNDVSSRHYDRYEYMPEKRAAMEKWAAYMDRILAGEFDEQRLPMAA